VEMYPCMPVFPAVGHLNLYFCHHVVLVFINREINCHTQLVDVSLMWQYVSTPKGHLQASGIKYIKGTVYHCVWGDLGVGGLIILGWISRRWDVGMWTGSGWPRIGTGGGRL